LRYVASVSSANINWLHPCLPEEVSTLIKVEVARGVSKARGAGICDRILGATQQRFEGNPKEGGLLGVLEGDYDHVLVCVVQGLERYVEIGNVIIKGLHKDVLLGNQVFNDSHHVFTLWPIRENDERQRGDRRFRSGGIAAMHCGRRDLGGYAREGCRGEVNSLILHRRFDFVQQAHPFLVLAFLSQAWNLQFVK
jgi:hypothetical protein